MRNKQDFEKYKIEVGCNMCEDKRFISKYAYKNQKTKLCHKCNGKTKRKHGMAGTRIYDIWAGMKIRCNNSNCYEYKWYGAKGIKYDESWEKFENFYKDMVKTYKEDLTLDRMDPLKGYCKENCRWVSMYEQGDNTSNSRYFCYKGENLTIRKFAHKYQIAEGLLRSRIENGWNIAEAIETPKLANQFIKYSDRKSKQTHS